MKKFNFEFVRNEKKNIFDLGGNFLYIDHNDLINDPETEHIFKYFYASCEEIAYNKADEWCFENKCFDYRMI